MQHRRGVRLFWPIILIGVGSILLLSNLEVIKGNPWNIILQLWPVLLIALGLEILFGGATGWRAVVSALLGLALVGGILWILIAQPAIPGLNFSSSNLQTTNISQPLNGVESARVDLSFGAGTATSPAISIHTRIRTPESAFSPRSKGPCAGTNSAENSCHSILAAVSGYRAPGRFVCRNRDAHRCFDWLGLGCATLFGDRW